MKATLRFLPDGILDPESVRVEGGAIIFAVEVPDFINDAEPEIQVDDHLVVRVGERMAVLDGKPVSVPSRCFDLLLLLASQPTRVFPKTYLYERVWGWEDGTDGVRTSRTCDSHASRLRTLLGGRYVVNRHGHGYSLIDPFGGS